MHYKPLIEYFKHQLTFTVVSMIQFYKCLVLNTFYLLHCAILLYMHPVHRVTWGTVVTLVKFAFIYTSILPIFQI